MDADAAVTLKHSLRIGAENAGKCKIAIEMAAELAIESTIAHKRERLLRLHDAATELELSLRALEREASA